MVDTIIIGAGPAGLTASIYALRYGLKAIIFDSGFYGGQVSTTSEVENYPAIKKISGIDFSNRIYEQAVDLGANIKFENVNSVCFKNKIKSVTTDNGKYEALTIIIANGAKRKLLECEGEKKFTGKGVSYCATCDGAFYKNKSVVIIGGGNTALEDALFLSNICNNVYIVHRRDTFRAEKYLVQSIKTKSNIKIIYNSEIKKIDGNETVSSVSLKNNVSGAIENLEVDGVFISIGFEPNNKIFNDIILDDKGYIKADESCKTNIEGVYVAGDSRTKMLRQIVTAVSDGAVAAFNVANYINTMKDID